MTAQYNKKLNWLSLKKSWLEDQGEVLTNDIDNYFVTVYFVAQTITTVGYGDYQPTNMLERIFFICLMIVGVIFFTFVSASLTSILQSYDE